MRSRIAFVLVLAAIGGAVAIDQVSPARPRAARGITVPAQGGALACPIAVTDKGVAVLHLANFGRDSSRVRVSLIPEKGKTQVLSATMLPGSLNVIRLSNRVRGAASAVVEYVGGEVVASHVLLWRSGPGPTGLAEAPCVRTGGADIAVLPARTLRADTTLALFNPGSADADVTISLVADKQTLHPERLAHRVVPGRSRRDFALGDFAFDSASVVAEIHATTGRVVAEALLSSSSGIELLPATAASRSVVAISGASGTGAAITAVPVGIDDTELGAQLITAGARPSTPRAPASLDPAAGATLAIPSRSGGGPVAYALTADAGSPLVAGAVWPVAGRKGQDFAGLPAATPSLRWGVTGGVAGAAGVLNLLIVCPGVRQAGVHIDALTEHGQTILDVRVESGRMLAVRIAQKPGSYGALVESDQPVVLMLQAISTDPVAGVLADGIAATALQPSSPVAPKVDPRAGVPAPIVG